MLGRMELVVHEIEGLRRSLAIGNGLPSDQIARLIETCTGLFDRYRELELRDERLRAELDALRPVVAVVGITEVSPDSITEFPHPLSGWWASE